MGDQLRKLLGLAAASVMIFQGAPIAGAEEGTYWIDWYGEQKLEFADPLARYQEFSVADLNGDGIAELNGDPLGNAVEATRASLDNITNLDIDLQVTLLGMSRDDIIAQIDLALSFNSAYDRSRENATALIAEGDYIGAQALLDATPAQVYFYCGDPATLLNEYSWFVGAPIIMDCIPYNGNDGTDMVGRVLIYQIVGIEGWGIDDIDFALHFEPHALNELPSNGLIFRGARWKEHNIGLYTNPLLTHNYFLYLSGLTKNPSYVSFFFNSHFQDSDMILYTLGSSPLKGKSVLALLTATQDFGIDVTHYHNSSASADFVVSFGSFHAVISKLLAKVNLPNGKAVDLVMVNFPVTLRLGFSQWELSSGKLFEIRFDNAFGKAIFDFEVRGRFFKDQFPGIETEVRFQSVGIPAKNILRIRPGNGPDGCPSDSNKVYSFDLTKGDSSVQGRYRTISVYGLVCDKDISGTVEDMHRIRVVAGRHDIFDADDNPLVMLAGTAHVLGNSKIVAIATEKWWFMDLGYEANLFHHDYIGKHAHWELGNIVCFVGCWGDLDWGHYYLKDGTVLNGYFWAISESQLHPDICVLKFNDGTCA